MGLVARPGIPKYVYSSLSPLPSKSCRLSPFSFPTLQSYRLSHPHSFFLPIVSIVLPPIILCLCLARVPRRLDSRSRGASTFLFSVPPPLLFFPHTYYRPLTFQTSDFALTIRVFSPGSSILASSGAGALMHSIILYS
jgi:hypothetical protein